MLSSEKRVELTRPSSFAARSLEFKVPRSGFRPGTFEDHVIVVGPDGSEPVTLMINDN